MTTSAAPDLVARLRRTQRALALLISLTAGLSLALAFLWLRGPRVEVDPSRMQEILDDPRMRDQIVEQLVQSTGGIWDSHADPDVGRILQPWLDPREWHGAEVVSNLYGMRERMYELPKPAGLVRVVLLGDSFVFGMGTEAEDRVGVFLEEYLRERAGNQQLDVEVLHLAIASWNVISECEFVRRQLSDLQPDVVLQVTVSNDLDDVQGVRGFSGMAKFAPRHRERADSQIMNIGPQLFMQLDVCNHLNTKLDYESRQRYAESTASIERLVRALDGRGARYVMIYNWGTFNSIAREYFTTVLTDAQEAYLPPSFLDDKRNWISEGDPHWNRFGMERLAQFLYGLITTRDLLPELELSPWDTADETYETLQSEGLERALGPAPMDKFLRFRPIDNTLDLTEIDREDGYYVLGGIDDQGRVSPYASILLHPEAPGGSVRLTGRGLDRPEMNGATVTAWADEVRLGEFEVQADQAIEVAWPLPEALSEAEYVTVRFTADDYVYSGHNNQHCVVFRLLRLAVE